MCRVRINVYSYDHDVPEDLQVLIIFTPYTYTCTQMSSQNLLLARLHTV